MDRKIETIAISKFKATCLAVLERVCQTGQPVLVTRRGEPIAEVIPPQPQPAEPDWLGGMADKLKIDGDVMEPVTDVSEWEVLKP